MKKKEGEKNIPALRQEQKERERFETEED